MLRGGNRYTLFVTLAKIILPMAALGLLASLFLLAGGPEETRRIPYSDVELDQIIAGQRLARPDYQGVLADGAALSVIAREATPDPVTRGIVRAEDVVAEITALDGLRTDITARFGIFDEVEQMAAGTGGVYIQRTDGYTVDTPGIRARIDGRYAATLGPIEIKGPGLLLQADHAVLTQSEGGPGTEVLVFSGNVKLIYDKQLAR